jgi:ribonuclease R
MEELDVPTPPFPGGQKARAADIAAALRRLSETLPRLSAREHRGRRAFSQLLLRSLKRARYDPENLGHFGLASTGYLHFTSPIRRYADLVVHRALLAQLGDDGRELAPGELYDVAAHCSTMERTIAKIELKADDIALAFLLERRLHEDGWESEFAGEIVGLIGAGAFVHIDRVAGRVDLLPVGSRADVEDQDRRGRPRLRPAARRPGAATSAHGPRRPPPRSSTDKRKAR